MLPLILHFKEKENFEKGVIAFTDFNKKSSNFSPKFW